MKLDEWLDIYNDIIEEFGFSKEDDRRSAEALNTHLNAPELQRISKLIKNKRINVFGAGPSLEEIDNLPGGINITADGASNFLLEKGVVPELIVTDLDGDINSLLKSELRGSIIVVHAHGDNIEMITRHAHKFKAPFGTTQGRIFGNLLNFGGFTDGDRAVYLAENHHPKTITLYGMDFNEMPGKYSFTRPGDVELKKKKLRWAEKLIKHLIETSRVPIQFAGGRP